MPRAPRNLDPALTVAGINDGLFQIDKLRYITRECYRFRQTFGIGRISRIILNSNDPIKSQTQYKHPLF